MKFDDYFFDFLNNGIFQKRKVENNYDESSTTNSKLCSECGGKCCMRCGCHFNPNDFKDISYETLKAEIEKGYISIEWVDGEAVLRPGGVYILRVRNVGKPIVDNSYDRSPCILWSEKNGCKLSYEKRPLGGRLLIPMKGYDYFTKKEEYMCHNEYDIDACFDDWAKYQEVLRKLVEYFR